MNRKWLYRQLIPYVSFFVMVLITLACITFISLNDMSKKASQQVNALATERLLRLVDYSLQEIDKLVIKELSDNSRLIRFFYDSKGLVLEEGAASETIRGWKVINPLIDSVYLYRRSDNTVLTNLMRIPLSAFPDAAFLIPQLKEQPSKPWSDPRSYQEPIFQGRTEQVVSLVKDIPFANGELGALVVNVKTSSIKALLNPDSQINDGYIELFNRSGHSFSGSGSEEDGKILAELRSEYTGWTLRSGLSRFAVKQFPEASIIIPAAAALFFTIIGILWFIFIARINYKPIGTIMDRLQSFTQRKDNIIDFEGNHELIIIDSAIDRLIRQSIDYEKTHEEDLVYKKKVFYHDVLMGNRVVGSEEWRREMAGLQLPYDSQQFRVIVAEIDKYPQFCVEYSQRDQNLIKFAMVNVAKEVALSVKCTIWLEWLESNKLVMLLLGDPHNEVQKKPGVTDLLEPFRRWVQEHLKYTVTIGVGSIVDSPDNISLSFEQASDTLKQKIFSGTNKVIFTENTIEDTYYLSIHEFLPEIRRIPVMYRMGEPNWQEAFNELFDSFRSGSMNRDDAVALINVLLNTFHREIKELPVDYQKVWESLALPMLSQTFSTFESLEEVQQSFLGPLLTFEAQMKHLRDSKQYASTVEEVRRYIDEHYTNPDLSLIHLADVFKINPKYISYLFKEQLGINFIDYLSVVRMENAKQILLSTDHSIPDIAVQVGYIHAVSFHRAFKKIVGVTPGIYRKKKELNTGERSYGH
ncbi:helix-turn-helix domain-containing protein [Paenibacillus sepulcri]|uniref:Helix-turn-helix domain-containing protein n=1 Tax=Paenibacillus sepulcri TaxID=359917 RepID=A0ABS7BWN0_9BACL|nr:helix-turn-helix domain-containing protein [Paenibacillus sepulcri]